MALVRGRPGSRLAFTGFSDWLIKIYDPVILWELQPTYILAQIAFILGAIITFVHAKKNAGKFPYLWLATVIHGGVVELVAYNLPDIDNFWHSQTPIIFVGRRLPLHIIVLYPVFIYHAYVAVSNMRLSRFAQPFAVGLVVVLIDIPYDIVSVKFVHWTWHDTDPNIFDRHYWVPWNSYYFHACFAASFTFWFNNWSRWLGVSERAHSVSRARGAACAALAGGLAMPCGVLLFLPLYHPLHDLAGVHSEVTFFALFAAFLCVIWSADRAPKALPHADDSRLKWKYPLVCHLIFHYSVFLGMVLFGKPENEVSIGLHETVGPCNETSPVVTAFGSVLQKRKFLCLSDYNEDYFDFKCSSASKQLAHGSDWYAICGTPFSNRTEYVVVVSTICLVAMVVFWNLHFRRNSIRVHVKNN